MVMLKNKQTNASHIHRCVDCVNKIQKETKHFLN